MGPGQGWERVEAQSCPFRFSYSLSWVSAQVVGLCVDSKREFLLSTS